MSSFLVSELSFFVKNNELLVGLEDERKRSMEKSKAPQLSFAVHMDNYKCLKDQELMIEMEMRRAFILELMVPLMASEAEMFKTEGNLIRGLLMFGALQHDKRASAEYLKGLTLRDLASQAAKFKCEAYSGLLEELIQKKS
jgi:hypothetical protein